MKLSDIKWLDEDGRQVLDNEKVRVELLKTDYAKSMRAVFRKAFKELKGSEKQVAWALKIREERLEWELSFNLWEALYVVSDRKIKKEKEERMKMINKSRIFLSQSSAAFFIENRDALAIDVIR